MWLKSNNKIFVFYLRKSSLIKYIQHKNMQVVCGKRVYNKVTCYHVIKRTCCFYFAIFWLNPFKLPKRGWMNIFLSRDIIITKKIFTIYYKTFAVKSPYNLWVIKNRKLKITFSALHCIYVTKFQLKKQLFSYFAFHLMFSYEQNINNKKTLKFST